MADRPVIYRNHPPPVRSPRVPPLRPARRWRLDNGLEVVFVDGATVPVLSVELLFNAGRPYQQLPLLDGITNELMAEGTRRHNAAELEALFEQYGTHLARPGSRDTGNFALSTITRLADRTLPLLAEVLAEPALEQASFDRLIRRRRQALREQLSDPDTIAYRLINTATFGPENPYGYVKETAHYDRLTLADVRAHHRNCYRADNATLVAIGQLDAATERLLNETFGQLPAGAGPREPSYFNRPPTGPARRPELLQHRRPQSQQTMLRRGRPGIRIQDERYAALSVLETVLGGYFGSRLMRNIREDKGYTYGIETDLDTYRFDGTFEISADVANENVAAVRREIDLEMDKLRQEPIGAAELDMVRSYLIGGLAVSLDGPLATGVRHRYAVQKQYDAAEHLRRLDEVTRSVTAAELQDLAQDFLRPGRDWEVIVGGAAPLPGAKLVEESYRSA